MIRKKPLLRQSWLLVLAFAALLLAGCAAAPKKQEVRYLFPPLPEEPHIEFIHIYYSQDNFPKTEAQKAMEAVVGKPPLDFFVQPNGIASDGQGKVYISDPLARSIAIYDLAANTRTELLAGNNAGIMKFPQGLAVDSRGRLFAVDGDVSKVIVFSAQGQPQFSFGGSDVLARPNFLALNERLGRVYVADGNKSQIVVFDLSGKYLFAFGKKGTAPGEMHVPTGIAIAADDRVYVADQLNARIQYFDADGQHLGGFGQRGDMFYQFDGPRGLAFDSDQNLHMLDVRQALWKIYRPDGTLLQVMGGGGKTAHPLGFAFPNAIWIDRNDRIYITDSTNRRFTVWQYLNSGYLASDPFELRKDAAK